MSNLLEKASIILTPTAYNNGEALCVKPSDGTGDFDFSRNSAATRVNAQGLVENVQTISANLLDYSTFTSPSASWSLVGGLWVYDDTANGYILTPNISVVVGDVFDVVVDVTIASGNANFRYASGNAQTTLFPFKDFVDGVNEFQATVTGVDGFLQRLFAPASLTDNPFTLNSISIKKISQDTNLPRINYEGGCGSWLFEPQSTNLVNVSEDFSVSSWSTNGGEVSKTLDASQATPSGINGSYAIEGLGGLGRLSKNITVTPSTDYTLSFYAKNIDATTLKAVITNITGTSTIDYISQVNPTSWSRVEINFTTGTGTTSTIYLTRDLPVGQSVYLWGVQLEELTYATSYIPTSGSTVTRNQDHCDNGGSLASINSPEGVLYIEAAALAATTGERRIVLSNGTNTYRVIIRITAPDTIKFFVGVVTNQAAYTATGVTTTNFNKMAISWKENDIRFYLNGTNVYTDTSSNPFPADTLNILDFSDAGTISNAFFGKTKCLAVWKEALTDAELTSLTTI